MEFGTLSLLKPVVAVAALAVGGMGAYNFATTGCMLGSCDGDKAAVTAVATPVASSCCASEKVAETTLVAETKSESDCAMACESEAKTQLVSNEVADAMKAACDYTGECTEAMKAACSAAGIECEDAASSTLVANTEAGDCAAKSECTEKTASTLVSNTAGGECSEKTECTEKKSDCTDKSECVESTDVAKKAGNTETGAG